MRPRKLAKVLITTAILTALAANPAAAAGGGGQEGHVDALAEEDPSGGPGSSGSGCTYTAVPITDLAGSYVPEELAPGIEEADNDFATITIGGIEGLGVTTESMQRVLTIRTCGPDGTWVWALIATPENLALGALDRLTRIVPFPDASFEPVDSQDGWLYVQVPTDFRFDDWQPVTARAEAGAVWATATATPSILRFDSGDPANPDPAECTGLAPTDPYDPANPGDCSYTYLNSSNTAPDGSRFNYEFTIIWEVTFDGSGGPDPLPPTTIDTTYTDQIQVAEARVAVQAGTP